MKLHLFDIESESRTQKAADTVCGITVLIGMFAVVHVLFAYQSEIFNFFSVLVK